MSGDRAGQGLLPVPSPDLRRSLAPWPRRSTPARQLLAGPPGRARRARAHLAPVQAPDLAPASAGPPVSPCFRVGRALTRGAVEVSPFWGIEKASVLQDARCFNDSQLDARKCQQAGRAAARRGHARPRGRSLSPPPLPRPPLPSLALPRSPLPASAQVITKLLYLLNQGDSFSKNEATEVFFGVTKLFQSKDQNLRRAVYLMIKEVSPAADEVIIVTSSLMRDMNSKVDLFRANSIRVLCKIVDAGMLSQMERYLKQAVVDKSPVVASAALVSGIHLLGVNADVVRRWSNEVAEASNSKHPAVQFHALALAHAIRAGDRLAASKLVSGLTRGGGAGRSPLATARAASRSRPHFPRPPPSIADPSPRRARAARQVLLVRFVAKTIAETAAPRDGEPRPFFDFLEACLRNKSEAAIFEAARAIAELKEVTLRELAPAVTVLQLFLSSSKPVLRFAAARTLNRVAMSHPSVVASANVDLEARRRLGGGLAWLAWLAAPADARARLLSPPFSPVAHRGPQPLHRHAGHHHAAEDGGGVERGAADETDWRLPGGDHGRKQDRGRRRRALPLPQVPGQAPGADDVPRLHPARGRRVRVQAGDCGGCAGPHSGHS